jgi:hypothetical protein
MLIIKLNYQARMIDYIFQRSYLLFKSREATANN